MKRVIKVLKDATRIWRFFGLYGGFHSVLAHWKGTAVLMKVAGPGVTQPIFLRVPSSDVQTYGQVFRNLEYGFSVEPPPETIVDAGANVGLASIYFAAKYPQARIIAIEPESSNYELLKKNVAPYRNIQTLNAALWNENALIDLIDPGVGHFGFITAQGAPAASSSNLGKVRAITMDRVIDDYGLDKIDILKIDIEGSEKEVFADTSDWIKKVDSVVIELHEYLKSGCEQSFYKGTCGLANEFKHGENICVSRSGRLKPH